MTPEERNLLERSLDLAEENNKILRGLRSTARWNAVYRTIYWVIIIGASLGAFYFIQPYLNKTADLYNGIKSEINRISTGVNSINSALPNTKK